MLANRLYYRNVSNNSHTSWSESDDNGETWKDRDFPIDFLALDGQNPNHLYGWRLGDLTSTYLPVGVRSEDDGDHWMQWAQQPCTPVDGDLLVSPFRSGLLFIHCSLGFGFFRSENGGDSWTKLPPIKGELWVADYSHPGRLLLAPDDSGELRQSLDNGESWQLLRPAGGVSPAQNRQPLYLPSITTQGH